MRIRYKKWARPELEASPFYVDNPEEERGKWRNLYKNPTLPLYLELGCGKGYFIANLASEHKDVNYIAIDLVDAMLGLAKRNVEQIYKEKNPKAKQKKKCFSSDSIPYLLAKHFEKCIQMHSPSFPSKEAQRQRWAKDIDLMLRIDKLDPDDIAQTIQWCQQDSFWKSNILSGKKLREKYQQLRIKMGR